MSDLLLTLGNVALNTFMLLTKRYTVYILQRLNVAIANNKMTHTEHQESHSMTPQSSLLYGLNDKPPFKDALFVELQHVCAIFIPVCTSGLLITGALGLDPATSYILGMSLFVFGLGTFIQVDRIGAIGSGLLAVQGTSFAFVTPILVVVATSLETGKTPEATLSLILGLCFFGSFILLILSRFLHLTRQIFTPLVTGTLVARSYSISIQSFCNCFVGSAVYGSA